MINVFIFKFNESEKRKKNPFPNWLFKFCKKIPSAVESPSKIKPFCKINQVIIEIYRGLRAQPGPVKPIFTWNVLGKI